MLWVFKNVPFNQMKQQLLRIRSNKSLEAEAERPRRLTCFHVIALTSGSAGLNPPPPHMVHLTLRLPRVTRCMLYRRQ